MIAFHVNSKAVDIFVGDFMLFFTITSIIVTVIIISSSGRGPEDQAVLHVSYNDGECGDKWGDILKLPKAIMDQEIHRALEYKFNRTIPKPLSTVYQYWNEGAW